MATDHVHRRVRCWAIAGWIAIVPLAIANGALRQAVLAPWLGTPTAQPISGVLLMLVIAGVAWLMVRRLKQQRFAVWVGIGAGWLVATVVFEFSVGLLAGRTWDDMLAPYHFADNDLWPIVLVWIACVPAVAARVRRATNP